MSRDLQLNIRVNGEIMDILKRAASKANLPMGTWGLLMMLQAAGAKDLADQLDRARIAGEASSATTSKKHAKKP